MKKLIIALVAISAMSAQAVLVVGDWINVDYGSGNGTPVAGTPGAAGNQGAWGTFNSGFNPNSLVKGNGDAIQVGAWAANSSTGGGGTGAWQTGTDALMQDYIYLGDGDGTPVDLNGTSVDNFRRFTIFGDDMAAGQVYNITVMGMGDTAGQGLALMVNNGGTYDILRTTGASLETTFELGRNYTTLNNVTLVGNELEMWLFTDDINTTSALNGIQMQLVPEPATLGLLGAFGGAFMFIRRRFVI